MRCKATYSGATLLGRPVRCEGRVGHDGDHGHSFAARYWPNDLDPQTADPTAYGPCKPWCVNAAEAEPVGWVDRAMAGRLPARIVGGTRL